MEGEILELNKYLLPRITDCRHTSLDIKGATNALSKIKPEDVMGAVASLFKS